MADGSFRPATACKFFGSFTSLFGLTSLFGWQRLSTESTDDGEKQLRLTGLLVESITVNVVYSSHHRHRRWGGACVPLKFGKIFFGQLLCKIRAFFEQKWCKIREFC